MVIMNGYVRNFQELFSQLTNKELAKQMFKYVTPPGGAPPPQILKCPISLVITNGYIRNFQKLFSQLTNKDLAKRMLKYVTPSWGSPAPIVLIYALYLWH